MAKNWSAAEAAQVLVAGTDKAAIQDIGKRFPLFAVAAARGTEGLLEIISALNPERITVRTIESKLKENVGEFEEDSEEAEEKPTPKGNAKKAADKKGGKSKPASKKKVEEDEEDEDEDEEEEEEAPKKKSSKGGKAKPAAKGKGKKKHEPEPEEDEDDEDEDDDGYDDMSLAELRKEAKKQKINIAGLKDTESIIAALRGEDDDEDGDDDEDDDDWDI